MKFQLVKTLAREITIKSHSAELATTKELVVDSLGVSVHAPESDNATSFAISFQLKATINEEEKISISCEYWAFFESDTVLTRDFLEGPFAHTNSPAIAYPYLRSFITTVLINAGYPAMYLPTVNFAELAKSLQNQDSAE